MTQLSTLENKTPYDLVRDSFDKYLVIPANTFGLGGFVFDVEGETTITAVNEITDHYVEDNSAVQDHIASRPLTVTLTSYVGELVDDLDSDLENFVQDAVQKLTILEAYLPEVSTGAKFVKESIEAGFDITDDATVKDVNNLWATIKNLNPASSRQQQAYLYFKALRDQKLLVSLQTPFEYIPNMAIETLIATQEEDSKYISNFTITLKQIRTVGTKFVRFDPKKYKGRVQQQAQEQVKKGKAQGESKSLLLEGLEDIFK